VRALGLTAIEIAPFDFFRRWDASDEDVRALKAEILDAGLTCPALQGILYQAPDVHLFASAQTRAALRAHLARVARIAGLLGTKACVLGVRPAARAAVRHNVGGNANGGVNRVGPRR